MHDWSVTLTECEQRICAWVGKQKFRMNIANGVDPGRGPSRDPAAWERNLIHGECCQFAAALILNLYWRPSLGDYAARDVGGLVEIRSGTRPTDRLIIKDSDLADRAKHDTPFALILAIGGVYHLAGWMFGREAAPYPVITEHGDPARFIDQDELHSNDALAAWLRSIAGEREAIDNPRQPAQW